MALNRNIELTTEEQEELAKNLPNLLKAIEEGNPAASAGLAFWRIRRSMAEEALEQAEEIQRQVASAIEAVEPEQGCLGQWCGFPTDMTRCSPFFPLNRKDIGQRKYLEDYLITATKWGKIYYSGPQLSIYEEDVLMSVLYFLTNKSKYMTLECKIDEESVPNMPVDSHDPKDIYEQARQTFTYYGPALPILKRMGYKKPNENDYKRLIKSLERMMSSVVKIVKGNDDGKEILLTNIINSVVWSSKIDELIIIMNPFFYDMYIGGKVTLIDIEKRLSLKGMISKALYRFIQSHRNTVFNGNFSILSSVMNINAEQPAWKIRQLIKIAINELIKKEILSDESGFVSQNFVRLKKLK